MSILGAIFSKIFPADHPAITAQNSGSQANTPVAPATAPASTVTVDPTALTNDKQNAPTVIPTTVDVAAVLTRLASEQTETLNWRISIVDLMKVVHLDSSLANRKSLARELHYAGDPDDTPTMNVWLHKEVMQKVADNGGQVPETLKG